MEGGRGGWVTRQASSPRCSTRPMSAAPWCTFLHTRALTHTDTHTHTSMSPLISKGHSVYKPLIAAGFLGPVHQCPE